MFNRFCIIPSSPWNQNYRSDSKTVKIQTRLGTMTKVKEKSIELNRSVRFKFTESHKLGLDLENLKERSTVN